MHSAIRERLETMAESQYAAFSKKLSPGPEKILGVRLPRLRKLAAELLKEEWRPMLRQEDKYMEETMLRGMMIAAAKMQDQEKFAMIGQFLPRIHGWAVCDSFCSALKMAKDHREEMWAFLEQHFYAEEEFEVRFAVVMLLEYYLEPEWIDRVLKRLNEVTNPAYYVKMAVAWAVSIAYVKFPVVTEEWLKTCALDDFTYQKSLQKAIESQRIDADAKQHLRELKKLRA